MNLNWIKPHLTVENIVMVTMAICILILLFVVFKKKPEPVDHSGTITLLQEQIKILEVQNEGLKNKAADLWQKDSAIIKQYEDRIMSDYLTIRELKKRANEQIDNITAPSFDSDSIRGAFSNL